MGLSLADRFWSKVLKGRGCWEWQGTMHNAGYGQLTVDGRVVLAHRLSAELSGKNPSGRLVCHRCDNRRCVRPDHLFLGSYKDNTQDAKNKGRLAKGEGHGRRVLSEEQVSELRSLTEPVASMARRFGISKSHAYDVRAGKYWSHV